MLTLAYLRENTAEALLRLKKKNFKQPELVDEVLKLDSDRRNTQKELDDTLAKANTLAKEIGALMQAGKKEEAEKAKTETSALKNISKELEEKLATSEKALHDLLVQIPNLPYDLVKEGTTPEDNEIVGTHGEAKNLDSSALPHWELAKKYDIIDFELGNKITGAGFPVYKGKGAKLQRALINFFLDEAHKQGFIEYEPPIMINEESGYGTGQLPDKEGQMYYVEKDNLFLIPTAEVPLTNLYRDVIVKEEDFPIKMTAYTPCFRREAGSYGAHVRGLNRLHQFDKVEIVILQHPEKSYETLEEMREYVESLLKKLGLTFRVLRLCGGDMGFTSAMTYDMEVYSAAQQKWLEVSSVSNFESFQANRLKLRYKDKNGKTQLAHTLNGSALALPRIVAALLENNQTQEGIIIPEILKAYTGFERID
ncbi:MAG: serine--tRNA ligase [Bacteroidetes bacterium]|nr:serine--tRNA ligase [Bacteroidota bacterium]